MKSQLNQIPWKAYGLTHEVVTPTLYALKHIDEEDKQLFTDSGKAWQIFALGLKALKNKEAGLVESSAGSDGSSKRSYAMGPGSASPKPKPSKKKRMATPPERSPSVSPSVAPSAKAKGKRRAAPVYSEDDSSSGTSNSDDGE
jgi:hypothetical protein